jgi:hypothetical protein
MSGKEKLLRSETRIITQGTAGTPMPPLPPPPVVAGPIFTMASFRVWTVSTPASASQTGIVLVPAVGFGRAVIKDSNTCWCADVNRNFSSVSIAVPTAPVVLDQLLTIAPGGGNQGLALDGTTIFLAAGGAAAGISFIDAIDGTDPTNLAITASYNLDSAFAVTQRFPRAIANYTTTHRLYVINASSGIDTRFAVYNATTPAAITQQGTLTLAVAPAFSQACDLAINHPIVYALLAGNGTTVAAVLKIIDVTNPAAPSVLSTTTIGGATDLYKKVNVRGTTLYIGGATLNDSVGVPSKILTYDVSNSAAPALSATLTLTGISRPLTAMFVRDGIAYVGSAGDGEANAFFSIWDLSTGFLFEDALSDGAVSGVALTGQL